MTDSQSDRPDLRAWEARLKAARDSQSSDLKASADKWASSLAVLIGAVGSISVLVVPKALTDFNNNSLRDSVFWLVLTAGLSGLFALGAATYVSQGWPKLDATMDAGKFAQETTDKAATAVTWLRVSRCATLVALICVIAASIISQTDTLRAPSTGVDVILIHQNGSTTCGPIAETTKTGASVTSVTVVSHC